MGNLLIILAFIFICLLMIGFVIKRHKNHVIEPVNKLEPDHIFKFEIDGDTFKSNGFFVTIGDTFILGNSPMRYIGVSRIDNSIMFIVNEPYSVIKEYVNNNAVLKTSNNDILEDKIINVYEDMNYSDALANIFNPLDEIENVDKDKPFAKLSNISEMEQSENKEIVSLEKMKKSRKRKTKL